MDDKYTVRPRSGSFGCLKAAAYSAVPYKDHVSKSGQRKRSTPLCLNWSCKTKTGDILYTYGDRKKLRGLLKPNLAKGSHDCPDCGYALFWAQDLEILRTY